MSRPNVGNLWCFSPTKLLVVGMILAEERSPVSRVEALIPKPRGQDQRPVLESKDLAKARILVAPCYPLLTDAEPIEYKSLLIARPHLGSGMIRPPASGAQSLEELQSLNPLLAKPRPVKALCCGLEITVR